MTLACLPTVNVVGGVLLALLIGALIHASMPTR